MPASEFAFDGQLARRVQQLEQKLRELLSGRRLEDASIGARGLRVIGGAITIDGGELKLVSKDGVTVAYWGDVAFGTQSRGWRFAFDTGSSAFLLGGDTGRQTWALYDNAGNYVMTNDGETGHGLGRPYLNYRLVPSFEAQSFGEGNGSLWPSTANTTATKVMQGINPVWHPRVSIGVSTTTIGGGSATWRLDIGGVTAATSAGGLTQVVPVPGWGSAITPGSSQGFDLYLHCSGGATRARIQCDRLFGLQS
ncbi:hypothetical protein AB0B28_08105 [Glycomyces sp. NPDC046736]|uniref:hypothetical protein n=1 Tax=Glycomyces sp. NPDC046736 TaxID=3155615 RepID=UPI0034086D1E